MLIDGTMGGGFDHVRAAAAASEAAGYAGLWTGETQHDPFLQVLLAAEATEHVTLGTSIAIAFGPHADDARQHGVRPRPVLARAASCSGSGRR